MDHLSAMLYKYSVLPSFSAFEVVISDGFESRTFTDSAWSHLKLHAMQICAPIFCFR